MKKFPIIFLSVLCALCACSDGEEIIEVGPTIKFSPRSPIEFGYEGGSAEIEVVSNRSDWVWDLDQTWLTVTRNGDKLTIVVPENHTRQAPPEAKLIVYAGSSDNIASAEITISQGELPVVDLSASGTSNCYVISEARDYMFDASVRGKSEVAVTESLEGCSVEWLWTTSEYIFDIELNLDQNGSVSFSFPDQYEECNAVVGLIKGGKVLWSWHIWVTDKIRHLDGHRFMNMNMGALSGEKNSEKALGFYYQWGRKDPFIGASIIPRPGQSTGSFDEDEAFAEGSEPPVALTAKSYVNTSIVPFWEVEHDTAPLTLEETAERPTTFIGKASSMPTYSDKTWSTENDPCPAGWKLPSYTEFIANFTSYETDFSLYQGTVQNGNNNWPAAGYRHTYMNYDSNGRLAFVGRSGLYWTATQTVDTGYGGTFCFGQETTFFEQLMKSYGFPVRCISELE